MNVTSDLHVLAVIAVAPFVLRADDLAVSLIWLALCAHAVWARARDLQKVSSR